MLKLQDTEGLPVTFKTADLAWHIAETLIAHFKRTIPSNTATIYLEVFLKDTLGMQDSLLQEVTYTFFDSTAYGLMERIRTGYLERVSGDKPLTMTVELIYEDNAEIKTISREMIISKESS